jgi:hypothetical protein
LTRLDIQVCTPWRVPTNIRRGRASIDRGKKIAIKPEIKENKDERKLGWLQFYLLFNCILIFFDGNLIVF